MTNYENDWVEYVRHAEKLAQFAQRTKLDVSGIKYTKEDNVLTVKSARLESKLKHATN